MSKLAMLLTVFLFTIGCGRFQANGPQFNPAPQTIFPLASAVVSVNSYGDIASFKTKPKIENLLIKKATASALGSAVVSVSYNFASNSTFNLNTANFGTSITVDGLDLNFGNIQINDLDTNNLRVCAGAPNGGRCNRLYVRVFTLGSNISGSITGIEGFINVSNLQDIYGIPVFAGSVSAPIGFNANQNAPTVTNAATVVNQNIPGSSNRLRLSNVGNFSVKADLSNAGAGLYEMRLVIQVGLGYEP